MPRCSGLPAALTLLAAESLRGAVNGSAPAETPAKAEERMSLFCASSAAPS